MKNRFSHIFPVPGGLPFLTVILTVKLARLGGGEDEEDGGDDADVYAYNDVVDFDGEGDTDGDFIDCSQKIKEYF